MKKAIIVLIISLLLISVSIYSFEFKKIYEKCGSACAPTNWFDGMSRLFSNPICIAMCVPGEYPTNSYLLTGYLGILGIIISIILFVKKV